MIPAKLSKLWKVMLLLFVMSLLFVNCNVGLAGEDAILEAIKYRIKGYIYQRQGDHNKAMENYKKAIQTNPFYACAHNDLGILYEQKGFLDKAEDEYLTAVRTDPTYPNPHTNLALLYERLGELKKAVYYWNRRASLGIPSDAWTRNAVLRAEELNKILKEEEKDQRYKIEKEAFKTTDIKERLRRGKIEGQKGQKMTEEERARERERLKKDQMQKQQAIKLAEQIQIQKRQVEVQRFKEADKIYQEGLKLYKKDDYIGAIDEFSEALKIFPKHRSCLASLDTAKTQLAKEEERIARHKQGLFKKAQDCYNAKNYEHALNILEELKNIDPNYPDTHVLLQQTQEAMVKEEAVRLLQERERTLVGKKPVKETAQKERFEELKLEKEMRAAERERLLEEKERQRQEARQRRDQELKAKKDAEEKARLERQEQVHLAKLKTDQELKAKKDAEEKARLERQEQVHLAKLKKDQELEAKREAQRFEKFQEDELERQQRILKKEIEKEEKILKRQEELKAEYSKRQGLLEEGKMQRQEQLHLAKLKIDQELEAKKEVGKEVALKQQEQERQLSSLKKQEQIKEQESEKLRKRAAEYIKKADNYMLAHQYKMAISKYKEAKELDPSYPGLGNMIEKAESEQNRFEAEKQAKAEQARLQKEYEKKQKEQEKIARNIDSYLSKAEKYLSKQKYDQAVSCYQKVLQLDPNYPDIKKKIEAVKQAKQQVGPTKIEVGQKTKAKPISAKPHVPKEEDLKKIEKPPLAAKEVKEIVKKKEEKTPKEPEKRLIDQKQSEKIQKEAKKNFKKGERLYSEGKYKQAVQYLELCLASDPTSIDAQRLLRYCLRRSQQGYYRPLRRAVTNITPTRTPQTVTSMPKTPVDTTVTERPRPERQVISKPVEPESAKKKIKAQISPPEVEPVVTTTDIDQKYEVLGVVAHRSETDDMKALNDELFKKAKLLGADNVIQVRYFQHKNYIYGYGTAVKEKK